MGTGGAGLATTVQKFKSSRDEAVMDSEQVAANFAELAVTSRDVQDMGLFRPPIHRSVAAILDRRLFSKTIPIAAARVAENKNISRYRAEFLRSYELLQLERITSIRPDPDQIIASKGGKCLLLQPQVKPDDPQTWSYILQQAVRAQELHVIPYNLELDYDYWTYVDLMRAILPEESQEIPVGFSIIGHIAHLNLRDQYLPFKHLIAQVLMDKNPTVKTVINKTDLVGAESEYRTFGYEVLAGRDDMNVEVRESACTFRFDYSKVYWNSRLHTEHKRLIDMFKPGEVVCDVMAGIGPFAVPAGKKGVFVWANDLNPDSYASMKDAIRRNKVENFVRPFCEDGHTFIRYAASDILNLAQTGTNTVMTSSTKRSRTLAPLPAATFVTIPNTITHFVMNLPASAISFLPSFQGLYAGYESLFKPHTGHELPMVHVYCFATKNDDNEHEAVEVCERISASLGVELRPGSGEDEVRVHDVRDVAPQKRMFCASFRLPAPVAFA